MTLRQKLLAGQLPLSLALVFLGIFSVLTLDVLAQTSERILRDNYRSVLAAQRMKESIERIDSAALFLVAGEQSRGLAQAATHRASFEQELRVQEQNVTEASEAESTRRLRDAWTSYSTAFQAFQTSPDAKAYFEALDPKFLEVKAAADHVLTLNQDAMARKSEETQQTVQGKARLMTGVSVLALVVGLIASFWLTSRLLRPLDNLSMAVRAVGEGDLTVRAAVLGKDEIAQVAQEFNDMATRLEAYRKSSLGELLQAQNASQAAIDSIPDPVLVFTLDGRLLSSNHAADTLLKLDVSPGKPSPLSRVEPTLKATLERVRHHVLSGKGSYTPKGFEEAVLVSSTEGDRYLLPRATPLYSEEEGVTGTTIILQDVTRLHRFDELRNNLVATVAHEFRTPLTSLRMAIHLCVEGAAGHLTEKQLDLLTAGREDCERLQNIVDDLLDMARLHAGKVELDRRAMDPAKLVEEALDAHRTEASRRQVALEKRVTPSLEQVFADPGRIHLVFANLISNALHHTPEGGTVTVTAEPEEGGVRFSVIDTGGGIPAEQLSRVFDRFYRGAGEHEPGAGLGLSIAREIVEAHGGEIGVTSEAERGATFWFTLSRKGMGNGE